MLLFVSGSGLSSGGYGYKDLGSWGSKGVLGVEGLQSVWGLGFLEDVMFEDFRGAQAYRLQLGVDLGLHKVR